MDCHGLSDRGRHRPTNEDRFLIVETSRHDQGPSYLRAPSSPAPSSPTDDECQPRGTVLAVADGMGGHGAGDVASSVAVETASDFVKFHMDCLPDPLNAIDGDVLELLRGLVRHCRDALGQAGQADPAWQRMGTTLTVAYIVWPKAYLAHVGDSRCYLIRGHQLYLLTVDHTMAELMHRQSGYETINPRFEHILWNALSADSDEVVVQAATCYLQPGDSLLLCTDGLHRQLSEPEIAGIVAGSGSAEEACRRLVDAANLAGGPDNITVIVANFNDSNDHSLESHSTAGNP